ncbi:uncharacterized protein [Coffea arabica]|uniref:Uncharacterized protein n=1 Tax=Coffea arabica TaxID=13443 RepID=A0A6P6UDS0_COFAR
MGDKNKALDFYMIAAHLTPRDASLWKLLVTWYYRLRPSCIKCGQSERAVSILESYLRNCCKQPDLNVIDILASLHIEGNAHLKALEHIENAQQVYCSGKEMPLCLRIKAGICHIHFGNFVKPEALINVSRNENLHDHPQLIIEIEDSLMNHGHYESALEYYMICLGKRLQSIDYFSRALDKLKNSVDAWLALSLLLLEENKDDEAISLLCPPKESESLFNLNLNAAKPWWLNGKIKLKLSQIYKAKGLFEAFVDVTFPTKL